MTNDTTNLEAILDGCLQQDRKAQEQLYRYFYNAMATLCLRYTKNEDDTVEVLNTGFYKVFKNLEKFNKAKGSLYTWIHTIMVNTCIDHLKKNKAYQYQTDFHVSESISIQPEIMERISAGDILQHIRRLPPATQAVFNLFIIEGFSHAEIGNMLGISEGTSKWHLNDARKKLKTFLTKYEWQR